MTKINSQKGKASRNKGKRGELELAHLLETFGYNARRGQQFSGKNGDADVVGVDGMHIECKRCESYLIDKWLEQSIGDAKDGEVPVVMFRKNNSYWKVCLTLNDFMELWNERKTTHRTTAEEEGSPVTYR